MPHPRRSTEDACHHALPHEGLDLSRNENNHSCSLPCYFFCITSFSSLCQQKRDLNLPLEFRMKVKESPVRDVIERLLRAEPSRRLGMYNDASSPPLHTAGGNNSPADLSNYPGAALPLGASGTSGGDGTIGILSHDFFKTLDYEALCKRSLTPSYMPRPRSSAPEDSSVRAAAFSKIKPFTGDQSTFSLF